jgi:penicillin-insensitive murein endopeptidase
MKTQRRAALIAALAVLAGCGVEKAAAGPDAVAQRAKPAVSPASAPVAAVANAPVANAPAAAVANAPAPAVETTPALETTLAATVAPSPAPVTPVPGREWHDVRSPVPGSARSIGGYSAGCVAGAARLPTEGDGSLLMRPGRHRHFGHPQLVDFIRTLGAAIVKQQLGAIVIGDLGQPRGGPAPDGHASHQSGLDADLWYPHAQTERGVPDGARERRALRALPVANFPRQKLTEHWSPRVTRVLQLASADVRVDRIFVNPMIKRALCTSETDRAWLRKLRPWWGHDAHFHVRLGCPKDSPDCRPQPALAAGDGCEQVDWWFSKEAAAEREQERDKYRAKVGPGDLLPAECLAILAAADK